MTTIDSADLFYKDGSSDKEYHLQLVEESGSYLVNFQYGRRGSTLQSGCKTKEPVSLEKARKVFDKILVEKTSDGYRKPMGASSGGTYTSSAPKAPPPMAERTLPQLLNPIDEVEVERLLRDDAWGCQEKKDGRHQMIRKTASTAVATNKKGIEIGYPTQWADSLQVGLYDGEAIGDIFHVFDLLEYGAMNLRPLNYQQRYKYIEGMGNNGPIRIVPLFTGYAAKKALLDKLRAEKREGIVFKKLDAPFKAGRPSSGGDMLKHKFTATASVIVVKHNDKDSIAIGLLDTTGKVVEIGNVTTIGHVKAPVGNVVEVRYLYGYKGGCLYQPAYIGPRDDVDYNECSFEGQKIKFKAEED